jgi:tRNA threonylcarbamoyladenosine biosynthesis protein TsaB
MTHCNLAIETTSPQGQITFGRDDAIIETAPLAKQRRHNIELMPAVDALFQRHGLKRDELAEVYVSLGPGSFTGLRIALATVKMLAMTLGVNVVGVPSVEVVAHNAPAEAEHVAVGLNHKRGTLHCQVFQRLGDGGLLALTDTRLRSLEELLDAVPRPVTLIGEKLPALSAAHQSDTALTVLPPEQALPRSEVVWQLGRARARASQFDDPATLAPLYIREPEAVTLWRERASSS